MANPTKGKIITAKETSPTSYDDILGKFRSEVVRKIESSIQYHRDNAADPTKTFFRVGINDQEVNPTPPGFAGAENFNGVTYWFTKGGTKLAIADVFGPATAVLPDDGQVPQNQGDRVDGQRSFWDVQGGTGMGPGAEDATVASSVGHAIYQHSKILCRIRKATISNRMAVTNKKWRSKSWPATFEGKTVQAKGDTLVQFEDLYTFSIQNSKTGITHLEDPFQSAPDWILFSNTVINDNIRGPYVDAGGNSPTAGPDPKGVFISADTLVSVFGFVNQTWEEAKDYNASVLLDYCHTSCHASCHSSRGRR